jgi:dihydrofolate reductase
VRAITPWDTKVKALKTAETGGITRMKAILSADMNWGIGYKGNLLMRVPEDMAYFKKMTTGKVVVMGRGTFESLPGMRPLKDRINIVLTRHGNFDDKGLIVCRSLDELFLELKKYPPGDIFNIGGESVYTLLLLYCSEAYVTRFEREFEADRHFPDLDAMENWKLVSESGRNMYNGMGYRFLKYVNVSTRVY